MNKTGIEWCDETWNPVTGCRHGCSYCYAKQRVHRFQGYELDGQTTTFNPFDGLAVLEKPLYIADKFGKRRRAAFPFGFDPTFHVYRLDEPVHKKTPKTIFVGSMCDLFGSWVPDEWIEQVFDTCRKAPQHRYLFLTKNPERYGELHDKGLLPTESNYWFGATITNGSDEHRVANNLPEYHGRPEPIHRNTFVSAEPLLGDIEGEHPMGGFFTYYSGSIQWAILGAESGNRKGRVVPEHIWIAKIVNACRKHGIPLFMKDSLASLWRGPLIREYPWEVST